MIGVCSVGILVHPILKTNKTRARQGRCLPNENVVFLKIHKTGSSTIANILQRFGIERNLTFALPNKSHGLRYNYIGDIGETISLDNVISIPPNRTYNILCNHVIFNQSAFRKVLPSSAFYLSLVREPVHQFLSSINYYSQWDYIHEILSLANPVSDYLASPKKFEPDDIFLSYTNNRQSVDFGVSRDQIRNKAKLTNYFFSLNEIFNLVMIFEYFDESLVLMKRYLCLTFRDILYIKKNVFPKKNIEVSSTDFYRLDTWLLADNLLYAMFYKEFWRKVSLEGSNFFEEVRYFKKILTKVNKYCINNGSNELFIQNSHWNQGFQITKSDCNLMKLSELDFMDKIISLQRVNKYHK